MDLLLIYKEIPVCPILFYFIFASFIFFASDANYVVSYY